MKSIGEAQMVKLGEDMKAAMPADGIKDVKTALEVSAKFETLIEASSAEALVADARSEERLLRRVQAAMDDRGASPQQIRQQVEAAFVDHLTDQGVNLGTMTVLLRHKMAQPEVSSTVRTLIGTALGALETAMRYGVK